MNSNRFLEPDCSRKTFLSYPKARKTIPFHDRTGKRHADGAGFTGLASSHPETPDKILATIPVGCNKPMQCFIYGFDQPQPWQRMEALQFHN
jgi:hypothetical protein